MNPYTPSSGQLFYGRASFFNQLLKDEEAGQSVVIVGGRRCGKTRLLEKVCEYLRIVAKKKDSSNTAYNEIIIDADDGQVPQQNISPHWPVVVNFQGVLLDSLETGLAYVQSCILQSLKELVGFPEDTEQMERMDSASFEAFLLKLDQELHTFNLGGLALLFDEIEVLFNQDWLHHLMALLRRIDDSSLKSRIWIVLVGSNDLDAYRNPVDGGSPPLNTTRRVFLSDLNYPARRRMAIEPFISAGRLPLHDDLLKRIDEWAGGHVWILTLLMEYLFNLEKPDNQDVDNVVELLLDQQYDVLQRWAAVLNEETWDLYGQIAAQGSIARNYAIGKKRRALLALKYQALVHSPLGADIEIGPALFREWAAEQGFISAPFQSKPVSKETTEASNLPPGFYQFDVAISYASPQREQARILADELRRLGNQVFFDQEQEHENWGTDLATLLPETYNRKAQYVVLLVSKDYVQRYWTQVEATAAMAKAIRDGWHYVLPVSLDGCRLPDIPDSILYIDIQKEHTSMANVVLQLEARLKKDR